MTVLTNEQIKALLLEKASDLRYEAVLISDENPRKAINLYQASLSLDPDNVSAWRLMSALHRQLGEEDFAKVCTKHAESLLRLNPTAVEHSHEIINPNDEMKLLGLEPTKAFSIAVGLGLGSLIGLCLVALFFL